MENPSFGSDTVCPLGVGVIVGVGVNVGVGVIVGVNVAVGVREGVVVGVAKNGIVPIELHASPMIEIRTIVHAINFFMTSS